MIASAMDIDRASWQFNRKLYDLSEAYALQNESSLIGSHSEETITFKKLHDTSHESNSDLCDGRNELMTYTAGNIIGKNLEFTGPFGKRHVVYCDYTASAKSLIFIENFLMTEVLPYYGNTHTTTSITSLQTTLYRHEAKDIIRNAVNASEDDALIFVGSGCTGAVHKLINGLDISQPLTVFVGASEHHSNLLPWREIAAKVVRIEEQADGLLNLIQLEEALLAAKKEKCQLIGCFSAASNITGTLTQDLEITSLLHRHGALSFWDYAAAAPYVKMNMNPTFPKYLTPGWVFKKLFCKLSFKLLWCEWWIYFHLQSLPIQEKIR